MNCKLPDIVGFCPEEAVWKMLADISTLLLKDNTACWLSPDAIAIEGDMFIIEKKPMADAAFLPPEEDNSQQPTTAQKVWMLGAIAYYMATGHIIFGGHGGSYQKAHPQVALPTMPKAFQSLTPVVQQCLCHRPSARISMEQLSTLSRKGLSVCSQRSRSEWHGNEPSCKTKNREKTTGDKWPEEMI